MTNTHCYSVGQVVKVVGNMTGHSFRICEYVEITSNNSGGGVVLYTCTNGLISQVLGSNEISEV